MGKIHIATCKCGHHEIGNNHKYFEYFVDYTNSINLKGGMYVTVQCL